MLNIPESVKTLFKRDGVRKNFRVHFPNGELPDITNENIVQESVKFTESLCSQDVLKFGLTEASVIEFETVGIGNMYGMTIEAGIEIDLSSLSAAELAEIEAGSWDGVYVSESDTDLGFPFFRVPYGVFRVESCPRDHQAMAHRKVKAYSANPSNLQMSGFEKNKLILFNTESYYTPDLYKLFLSQFARNNPQLLYDLGFTDGSAISQEFPSSPLVVYRTLTSAEITVVCNGVQHTVKGQVSYNRAYTYTRTWIFKRYGVDRDKLYALDYNGYSPDTILGNSITAMQADATLSEIDLAASGYSNWEAFANDLFICPQTQRYKAAKMLYPQAAFSFQEDGSSISYSSRFTITEKDKAIYPRIGDETATFDPGTGEVTLDKTYCSFMIPFKFEIIMDSTTVYSEEISNVIQVKQYNEPAGLLSFPAKFNPTLESGKLHSFSDSYSLVNIMTGLNELLAMFSRVERNGGLSSFRLTKANPISVVPGEYSQFWWDEYDILPIGAVAYTYTDAEEDSEKNTTYYYFGTGESVYDMTDNKALEALSDQSMTTIENLFDLYFVPNLDPICFTPIDLTMKGLPYLEAGDYLAVTAEDGTIAYSFAMRQTISGIQVLTAEIESTSGDIIESEEGET